MKLTPRQLLTYTLLVGGAVVCAFPFAWMLSTSTKVDRELFVDDIRLKPETPSAAIVSPYVDTARYASLPGSGDTQAALLPALTSLVGASTIAAESDLLRETARGVYSRVYHALPDATLKAGGGELLAAARLAATPALISEVSASVRRELSIGSIEFRSTDREFVQPMKDSAIGSRLTNETPDVARVTDVPPPADNARRTATIAYDFSRGEQIRLSGTFALPFDAAKLAQVSVPLKPDDSWHNLTATLEAGGKRYVADRQAMLANSDWATFTWRLPAEVSPGKIKTWYDLRADGDSSVIGNDAKLTLTIDRATPAKAWFNKLKRNYERVLDYISFWQYIRVSLFLVGANIVLTLISSSLAAFAFARLKFPGKDALFLVMLATLMIPSQVVMIPHFLIWKEAGAYDTLSPLWIASAFGNAYFIFLLRQFMRGVPPDLEDAARIDGCGFLRIYWHVALPMVKPALAAIAIFTFMGTWNDFMGPLIYLADQRLYPLAFGLYAFAVQVGNSPTLTMAASALLTLPVVLLFFFAQRYFVQGITLTGMKG